MGHVRRSLFGLATLAAMAAGLTSCSSSGHPADAATTPGPPALLAAANASLAAESAGLAAGNPTLAASLDSGAEATALLAIASAIASQMAHGLKANYSFRPLDVRVYPLDRGATDFMAFATIQDNTTGGLSRRVELFQRSEGAGQWTGNESAWFNDNIDLPQLRLSGGSGHLLTPSEMRAAGVEPMAIASRYASAINAGTSTGSLGPGTFTASESTTGIIASDTGYVDEHQTNGGGSVAWTAQPGGAAVQLTDGVLVFCSEQEHFLEYRDTVGQTFYFDTQDPEERSFGGLLAPGNYSSVSTTRLVTLAVVVPTSGLPDVVGLYSVNRAVTGTLAGGPG